MKVELQRKNQAVHFEGKGSSAADIKINIDGSPEIGGEGLGVRPMELVLMALGSCSSLDLLAILKKQRQQVDDVKMEVSATRADAIPAVFKTIHITFKFKGDLDRQKVEKAVELAVKKYCSVHDMLAAGGVEITYSVEIE